jgi:SAM-dependent methyltransferase
MQTPEQHYRGELGSLLRDLAPASILEPGSGDGAFLRSVDLPGVALQGLEPHAPLVEAVRGQGFAVEAGRAEQMPFADASFDLVVFSYTAHHVEDWAQALHEALRVARRGVVVLDPWYDDSIPSQEVAHRFDGWAKAIHRAAGIVHHDVLPAGALTAPLGPSDLQVRLAHLLLLRELGIEEFERQADASLRLAQDPGAAGAALDPIRADARRVGISEDGALLLSLLRP